MDEETELFTIRILSDTITISVKKGSTLLEGIEKAGISLNAECGGDGSCGKCRVQIVSGNVQKHHHLKLSETDVHNNIQLACLTTVLDNLEIYIPDDVRIKFDQNVLGERRVLKFDSVKDTVSYPFNEKSLTEKITITADPPTLEHNPDDFERIKTKLEFHYVVENIKCSPGILKLLPEEIRKQNGLIDITLCTNKANTEIINIASANNEKRNFGLAIDIGTTTIAVQLINLCDGKILCETTEYNSQIMYGADIISRIIYSLKDHGLEKLRSKVLSTINTLIETIVAEIGINSADITCCSIAGNTTMQHLLLGITPRYIREEPYVPAVLHFSHFAAHDLSLHINPNAIVYLTPGVGSYVGGDITAGVLQSGMNRSKELTLFVDLGTNAEIILGNSEWMSACACSAGPAFEGGGVKCGMRAMSGAIGKIQIDKSTGELVYDVINGDKPKGICGSAMIDLLAHLYFSHCINQKGKFIAEKENKRIRKYKNHFEYVIAYAPETAHGEDIVITTHDIDNLIRTKGAIWAGIATLLKAVEIKPSDIQRIIIAGAFGNYINIEHAIVIGMLPDVPVEKYSFIGNSSLHGAALTLISDDMRNEIEEISRKITNFELSVTPGYMDEFIASLFIPHTHKELFPSFVKKDFSRKARKDHKEI
ncbi:MAG: ASKHA domain-containing protein [Patescibacteria group bacterium]|nr:ASKHA domain-containing protein [Patescibacteria group bacterium]